MKIMLIRPRPHPESIGLQSFMICEPLELEYLAANITPAGHEVVIIDMILERKSLASFIKKHRPDLVGFTAYINHVNVVKSYARTVKKIDPAVITVVGGVHAEVIPNDFESPDIDFIIHVNGIKTFQQLVEGLEHKQPDLKRSIDGIWVDKSKPYVLDQTFNYHYPDRKATRRYRQHYNYIFHNKCAIVKTSFGCKYHCDFCFCVEVTRHHYFERELNDVIQEIKGIEEHNIFIVDDDFLLDKDRVVRFCELLAQYNIRKNFILFGRADFIVQHEDCIALFQKHGLNAVFMGLESFKKAELIDMNKRLTVDDNVRAISILEKYGIECHAGIIVNPTWTKDDFNHLITWINKFAMLFVNIQPLTPMPGTKTYEALKHAIMIDRTHFEKWDMAHMIIQPEHMSIRKFYRWIIRSYYKTSTGLKGHKYILKKYGFKTYVRTLYGSLYITMQYFKMWLQG